MYASLQPESPQILLALADVINTRMFPNLFARYSLYVMGGVTGCLIECGDQISAAYVTP